MSYWDTSALAKLYLQEPDSAVFRNLAAQLAPVNTAHLTRHELRTVFLRREAEGVIVAGAAAVLCADFEDDIASGLIAIQDETDGVRLEFVDALEKCIAAKPPIFVRTNDALHIASAMASAQTQFVSADLRQKAAAVHIGLSVLP
jgi:predicted nucleic acid-binding protein